MLRTCLIATLVVGSSSATVHAQEPTGRVCIAPAKPPTPGPKSQGNPTGENRVRQYTIQIDSLSPVQVSSTSAQLIPSIPSNGVHWVRIKGDGKLVESFKFKFSDFPSTNLCLFFNPLYETWNLRDAKQARSLCKCDE